MTQRINLLPEDLRTVNKRFFYFIASLSVILYILILYSVSYNLRANIGVLQAKREDLRQRVAVLARQDAKYKEVTDKINVTEAKKRDMEARAGLVKRISEWNTRWSDPLYELSNIVPAGVWLSTLSSSDIMAGDKKLKGIRVSGMALSSSRITDFMAAVEASPYFEGVSLAYLQNAEYKGREAFSFEIAFRKTYLADGNTATNYSGFTFNSGTKDSREVVAVTPSAVQTPATSGNFTKKAAGLAAPALNSPPDNAPDVPTTGEIFSWSAVPGATDYRVVVDTSPAFSNYDSKRRVCSNAANCKTYAASGNTATSYSGFTFNPGIKYYWKVVAGNPSAGPNWATSRTFTTRSGRK